MTDATVFYDEYCADLDAADDIEQPHEALFRDDSFPDEDDDMARCDAEIQSVEAELRSGNGQVHGLVRALIDWRTERKLIAAERAVTPSPAIVRNKDERNPQNS